MLPGSRASRVADEVRKEITEVLLQKARDPRIGFLTITAVKVTDDLHHARVYVSLQEDQDAKKTFAALKKASGFFRGALARNLPLRRVPDIAFFPDQAVKRQSRILDLLDEIRLDEEISQPENRVENTSQSLS